MHDFYGPSEPTTQTASRSAQPFSHRGPQSVPILYNGTLLPPVKLPLPMVGSGPPSNTWFPGPIGILNPNAISIGSFIFAWLTSVTDWQTDRQTDHATRSVTIGRIYVRSTVVRPNSNHIITIHSFLYRHKVVPSEAVESVPLSDWLWTRRFYVPLDIQ